MNEKVDRKKLTVNCNPLLNRYTVLLATGRIVLRSRIRATTTVFLCFPPGFKLIIYTKFKIS